ncbi:putative protein phosphatase 2C 1 [Morella rubra]|uniref:Protein phosphatase n=1 Tax=Morella rubra TaxID=262757 RepID=A0A6A1VHT1_9ROSI|nr:putative protein phosphatase 2C 1 [Morella rubra]
MGHMFFFKSQVIATNKFKIGKCEDFVWVTKDELLEFFLEQAEFLNKMNVDPSLFPWELMVNASIMVGDDEVNNDPQILLRTAHAATFSTGSATVIVAMLERNGILKIANVGDCGVKVIREGQIFFSTSPQEHYFDCPYQLSSEMVGQYWPS